MTTVLMDAEGPSAGPIEHEEPDSEPDVGTQEFDDIVMERATQSQHDRGFGVGPG